MDIKELIKKRILDDKESVKRANEPIEFFHSSSLGYCKRQIFLSKINAKDFAQWIKGSMRAGTNLHNWIQSFQEIKDACLIEQVVKYPINDKVFIKGSADIVHKQTGYVWDIKSIKTLTFVYGKPKDEHVEQLNSYLFGLGSKEGEILYIQKSDLAVVSHKVTLNVELFESTKKKVMDVYEQLLLWDSKQIKYCPFDPCSCYFCKNENLKPEFKDIDAGRPDLRQ